MFGSNLGGYELWDPDESKHAEIAREMMIGSTGLEPSINFEPYHDKPSFLYVLVAASYRVFGVNEFAARVLPSTASCLILLALYWYSARRGDDPEGLACGLLSALLLASTALFVFVGRFVNFDAALSALVAGAMLYWAAWAGGGRERRLGYTFYALIALGVLIKGPVAIVLAAVPVLFALFRRDVAWSELNVIRGSILALLIIGLWTLPVAYSHPDYLRDFIWDHNIRRYTSGDRAFHSKPLYFFIPVLLGGFLPWSFLSWEALRSALRRGGSGGSDRVLAVYVIWVFVFFSVSVGKLATYILPCAPILALLVARFLIEKRYSEPRAARTLVSLEAAVLLLLPVGAAVAISTEYRIGLQHALVFMPAALTAAWVLGSARGRACATLPAQCTLCAGTIITFLCFFLVTAAPLSSHLSDAELARVAKRQPQAASIVTFGVRPYSFLFYWGPKVVYSQAAERARDAAFYRAALFDEPGALVLTKDKRLPVFSQLVGDPGFRELARTGRHVLLVPESTAPKTREPEPQAPSSAPSERPDAAAVADDALPHIQ